MSVDDWLDDFVASYARRRPVCATFVGIHDHDGRLPDYSPAGRERKAAELRDLRERLADLPEEDLDEGQRIDRRLAEGALRIQQWENETDHYIGKNPAFYTGKAVFGVIAPFLREFAPLDERVPDAVSRTEAIPEFLAVARENLDAVPAGWTDRARDECEAAVALFEDGLPAFADERGVGDPAFDDACAAAAQAFEEFGAFLDDCERRPDGHACGADAFGTLLADGHCFERSPSELASEARAELQRCERYLDDRAGEFGAADREAALAMLEEEHPTAEEYYDRYRETWEACRRAVQDADALTWPDYPVEFVPRPEWVREAARNLYFLFYRAPAAFDDVTPVEYLVEPVEQGMDDEELDDRLRRNNDAEIKLNHVVHHGGVGHHVQNWNAYERADSRLGRFAAVDCASRIALYAGGTMAEGWACYATELMDELGFLTALESYSLRHSRLRFAARTVVDVELHCGDMSYEEAVAFYRDRAGMSEGAARYEATRNSMFPGMAVLYLRPMQIIHELREEFETALGAEFDRGWFHDEFLSYGSIPVALVAERMREKHLAG